VSPLYRFDLQWFRAINIGWHSPILDPFFHVLSVVGLGEVETLITFSLLLFKPARKYVFPLLFTLLLSSLTSQLPKHFIPRDRPSNLTFAIAQEPWKYHSFPSGHATSAFAMAFMIVLLTHRTNHRWIGWVSLVIAALIGISRIYRGVHWPSDVIAGVFFGCGTAALAYLFLLFLKRISGPTSSGNDQLTAATGP